MLMAVFDAQSWWHWATLVVASLDMQAVRADYTQLRVVSAICLVNRRTARESLGKRTQLFQVVWYRMDFAMVSKATDIGLAPSLGSLEATMYAMRTCVLAQTAADTWLPTTKGMINSIVTRFINHSSSGLLHIRDRQLFVKRNLEFAVADAAADATDAARGTTEVRQRLQVYVSKVVETLFVKNGLAIA